MHLDFYSQESGGVATTQRGYEIWRFSRARLRFLEHREKGYAYSTR